MTKTTLLLCITVFFTTYIIAQEPENSTRKNKVEYVDSEYARPSITCLYLESPEWTDEKIKDAFQASFTNLTSRRAKFFLNSFSNNSVGSAESINFSNVKEERKLYASKENKNWLQHQLGKKIAILKPEDAIGISLGEFLETSSIPGEIMRIWAQQDQHGDFITLNQRSDYNLSANDLKDSADSEKLENFKSLLFKNYILLYAVDTYSKDDKAQPKISKVEDGGYSALFSVYVYKIEITEAIFNQQLAPNFKDESKIASIKYPIKYVGRFIDEASSDPEADEKTKMNATALLGKFTKEENRSDETKAILSLEEETKAKEGVEVVEFDPKLSQEEIYSAVVAEGFERTMILCEKAIDDFKIRTMVSNVLPFEAEVGKREGLEADQRYRIYEYRENPDNGEVRSEIVGLARVAGHIADNIESREDSTGGFLTSRFKQTYGKDLKEGMFMVQHNDLGLNIALGFGMKNSAFKDFGGKSTITFEARGDYNVGHWINKLFKTNIYGFCAHIGLGFGPMRGLELPEKQSVNSMQIQFGLSKAFYISRKFDVIPYISFVSEQANAVVNNEVTDFSEQFQYFEFGARAKYPLTETFSIEPRLCLNIGSGLRESSGYYMGLMNFAISGRWEF